MPELTFRLRWPDGSETVNYSPSTVVTQFLSPGASYGIDDFLLRARQALNAASARVEHKYGHPCARAHATLDTLEGRAKMFVEIPAAEVTIMAISP
jgi:uncharacterized repeat protein (TIGR04042 family)